MQFVFCIYVVACQKEATGAVGFMEELLVEVVLSSIYELRFVCCESNQ